MCTLTYRLTKTGYEIFFNRDEQRSRRQALPPMVDKSLNAIYPVDPVGKGTWLAVHESGLSLALLNYYHAKSSKIENNQTEKKEVIDAFVSRGEIILRLLKEAPDAIQALQKMKLHCYQPFQICIFESGLSLLDKQLRCFQWDGERLTEFKHTLPITSSGVDYPQVYQARKTLFNKMVCLNSPSAEQLLDYHYSQQAQGKLSVNMSRLDAKTVSFSRITIAESITFEYKDHQDNRDHFITF